MGPFFFTVFPARLAAVVVLTAGLTPPALAGEPVAIVEEAPARTGVVFMDYLDAGYAFELAPAERLIVNYLRSCLRETIVGGQVVIGFEKSAVEGGQISRKELDRSGRGMKLSPDQAQESASSSTAIWTNTAHWPQATARNRSLPRSRAVTSEGRFEPLVHMVVRLCN